MATESPLNFILAAPSTLFRGAEFHVVDFRADRFPETVGTAFPRSREQADRGSVARGSGEVKSERDADQWPRPLLSRIAN